MGKRKVDLTKEGEKEMMEGGMTLLNKRAGGKMGWKRRARSEGFA